MLLKSKLLSIAMPLLALLIVQPASCSRSARDVRLIGEGNEVISRVERFRESRGRLPDSLSEVGIEEKEEGPIYYDKKSATRYVLWFGKELGESVTYDSDKKEWKQP